MTSCSFSWFGTSVSRLESLPAAVARLRRAVAAVPPPLAFAACRFRPAPLDSRRRRRSPNSAATTCFASQVRLAYTRLRYAPLEPAHDRHTLETELGLRRKIIFFVWDLEKKTNRLSFYLAVSDNIRNPSEEAVYRSFERALETGNPHTLWVGLDRCVPREVFRRLGLREPTAAKVTPSARFAPYARPDNSDLKFLNPAERAELEAVQKVKEEHALVKLVAQRKEREAEETAAYLTKTCLIRKEREELERREAELAQSAAAKRIAAAKSPEPYIPTPVLRPATLVSPETPGPSAASSSTEVATPRKQKTPSSEKKNHSPKSTKSSRSHRSRTSSKGKDSTTKAASEAIARQFKKHGIQTDDEDAVLESPKGSPYSA
ncbi:hypothetical protein GHT06_021623 [Daphnia sinensis]|uniref:Uncharacterized protein n=1 Tax=Daphnia sinensis TaxID=1820382 RepID=A0AAD5PSN5_9CRUS|nr:hypothetical protein GHT06_021623 [Daphnia sinensis]